ncbi:hypothetical protein U5B43_02780 [Campylobacter sp. 9BO]|uniref:hypothetical protein n=1 Tax=Campylobacter sp. 9BO TaxID=3424759 RepID=UPI003D34FD08
MQDNTRLSKRSVAVYNLMRKRDNENLLKLFGMSHLNNNEFIDYTKTNEKQLTLVFFFSDKSCESYTLDKKGWLIDSSDKINQNFTQGVIMRVCIDVDAEDILQELKADDVLDYFDISELMQAYYKRQRNMKAKEREYNGCFIAQSIEQDATDEFLGSLAFALNENVAKRLVQYLKNYKKIKETE